MAHKIIGIADIEELNDLREPIRVCIFLKHPGYKDLIHLEPKERVKVIRKKQREDYKAFVSSLPEKSFTRIGSRIAPRGIEIECTQKELLCFNKEKKIGHISIVEKESELKLAIKEVAHYYTVVARFVIQVENKKKGLQSYEDRMLLVKAKNGKEAEKKLRKNFKKYEEPYLNSQGEMVRWKFEEFIDCYQTTYQSLEGVLADEEEGIEVYSVIRSRRLSKEQSWLRTE